jgi:hypothetical protein
MSQQTRNNETRVLTPDELDAVSGGAKSLHNEFSVGGYKMTIDADAVHYTVVVTRNNLRTQRAGQPPEGGELTGVFRGSVRRAGVRRKSSVVRGAGCLRSFTISCVHHILLKRQGAGATPWPSQTNVLFGWRRFDRRYCCSHPV